MKQLIILSFLFLLMAGINQKGHAQQKNCNGPFQVDISSNATHTFDEVLLQLGITTVQQFNSLKPQFDMVIGGTLLLDNPNQEIEFYGTRIKMLENAKISVVNNTTLKLLSTTYIYGCGKMWEGINLTSSMIIVNIARIEDAKCGILAESGTKVDLQSVFFNNNYKGIQLGIPGDYPQTVEISLSDCTFTSDGNYLGENLEPLAGIFLHNIGYADLGPKYGEKNTFQNLRCGIFAWASAIRVIDTDFKNINSGSGLFNHAINLYNYGGQSIGTSIINHNYFYELNNAIRSDRSNIYAQYNEFLDVINGISVIDAGIVSINHNTISAKNIGIEINSCNKEAYYLPFDISDNSITIELPFDDLNTNIQAINLQLSDGFRIIDNTIEVHK